MTWPQICENPMDLFTVLKTIHDSTNLFIESDTNELVYIQRELHQQRWDVPLECWCVTIWIAHIICWRQFGLRLLSTLS